MFFVYLSLLNGTIFPRALPISSNIPQIFSIAPTE